MNLQRLESLWFMPQSANLLCSTREYKQRDTPVVHWNDFILYDRMKIVYFECFLKPTQRLRVPSDLLFACLTISSILQAPCLLPVLFVDSSFHLCALSFQRCHCVTKVSSPSSTMWIQYAEMRGKLNKMTYWFLFSFRYRYGYNNVKKWDK